jgi:glycosyltransferase involved in cell wall biosynthesis
VCLEAMAAGRPVVCLDAGGPAMQVTPESGFVVRAVTPEQVVSDIAGILLALAADPKLQAHLGEGGRRRVASCFDWDTKGRQMNTLYEESLG